MVGSWISKHYNVLVCNLKDKEFFYAKQCLGQIYTCSNNAKRADGEFCTKTRENVEKVLFQPTSELKTERKQEVKMHERMTSL